MCRNSNFKTRKRGKGFEAKWSISPNWNWQSSHKLVLYSFSPSVVIWVSEIELSLLPIVFPCFPLAWGGVFPEMESQEETTLNKWLNLSSSRHTLFVAQSLSLDLEIRDLLEPLVTEFLYHSLILSIIYFQRKLV